MPHNINPKKCVQNHLCLLLNVCPANAITQVNHELPIIDKNKCFDCYNCTYHCPKNAVEKVLEH